MKIDLSSSKILNNVIDKKETIFPEHLKRVSRHTRECDADWRVYRWYTCVRAARGARLRVNPAALCAPTRDLPASPPELTAEALLGTGAPASDLSRGTR